MNNMKEVPFDDYHVIIEKIKLLDEYTYSHCNRVSYYVGQVVKKLGIEEQKLVLIAKLHDLGKVNIPREVLNKKGSLSKEEFDIVKNHSQDTYDMLIPYLGSKAAAIARNHHEKLDGSGYPQGLTAEQLTLVDRIIPVCDIFDALTSKRSYHEAMNVKSAFKILKTVEKEKVDQKIVAILEELINDSNIKLADQI